MMKMLLKSLVLVSACMLPQQLLAADINIGVVNAAAILEGAPQTVMARKNLEKEFAPREKKLVAQQKEIKRLEEKLSRDAAVMSDDGRRKLDRDIQNKKRDWKRANTEFREDVTIRQNELLGDVQKAVMTAIKAIAKEDKFDLILGDGVIFASDKVNITDLVISRLKKQAGK